MIWESWPWKQELKRLSETIADDAARIVDVDNEDENSAFGLERAVFYSAFVVRKLIENCKVTDKVRDFSLEVDAYKSLRPKAGNLVYDLSASCDLEKEFDLNSPEPLRMSPYKLLGEIIHSHKLMWEIGEEGQTTGIYVCSYHNEEDRMLRVPLALLCELINFVAADKVTKIETKSQTKDGTKHVTIKRMVK